jgi:hypothetical protein
MVLTSNSLEIEAEAALTKLAEEEKNINGSKASDSVT